MLIKLQRIYSPLVVIATLLVCAHTASAQDPYPKTRLRSPAVVREGIGGEAHNAYVIRARKGQRMTVQISWIREGDNRAEFNVSDSGDFNGESRSFGKTSGDGKRFTGKIPRTGDYYIYVVAHPSAEYTLRVRVR